MVSGKKQPLFSRKSRFSAKKQRPAGRMPAGRHKRPHKAPNRIAQNPPGRKGRPQGARCALAQKEKTHCRQHAACNELVRGTRLELAWYNHTPLKRARLPIPPPSHMVRRCAASHIIAYLLGQSQCHLADIARWPAQKAGRRRVHPARRAQGRAPVEQNR